MVLAPIAKVYHTQPTPDYNSKSSFHLAPPSVSQRPERMNPDHTHIVAMQCSAGYIVFRHSRIASPFDPCNAIQDTHGIHITLTNAHAACRRLKSFPHRCISDRICTSPNPACRRLLSFLRMTLSFHFTVRTDGTS